MKKLVCLLGLLFTFILAVNNVFAAPQQNEKMTFETAMSQQKPALILLYAVWADDAANCLKQFNSLKNVYGNRYNYVIVDVASRDMKAFNKTYVLQPNLPYMMMSKTGGKMIRYMQKDCILDNACIMQKTKSFAN